MIEIVLCLRISQEIDQILEIIQFLLIDEDITSFHQYITIVKSIFSVLLLQYFSLENENWIFWSNKYHLRNIDQVLIQINHQRIVLQLPQGALRQLN